MVTFLHDAGKGRKRDHHIVGASLFKIFAQKLHMKPELVQYRRKAYTVSYTHE